MKYVINTRELLRANPSLTEEMLMTKTFEEILNLLKETREETNQKEDLGYLKKSFQTKAKKACFSVYSKFAGYVPDKVLFKAIYSYVNGMVIEEQKHWRKFPGIFYTSESNGEYRYQAYIGYNADTCEGIVINAIIQYYYPCFSFLPYHISKTRLGDVFDYFFIYDIDDIDERGSYLMVSLMDIISGDVDAIINANISSSNSESYNDTMIKLFNMDFVRDFIDIIKNKRNKDAIYSVFPTTLEEKGE